MAAVSYTHLPRITLEEIVPDSPFIIGNPEGNKVEVTPLRVMHGKQMCIRDRVLVNCGGATGDEVIALARRIQESVLQKFGVAISPEVNFI